MYDLNIHLPIGNKKKYKDLISEDLLLEGDNLINAYLYHKKNIEKFNTGANFMLFSKGLKPEDIRNFKKNISLDFESHLTWLVDFRDSQVIDRIHDMKEAGINGIKFHSYIQLIEDKDIVRCLKVAKLASNLNLSIFIDASYGSTKMYKFDNLKLAAAIIENLNDVPIVILHSGGSRVIEALHLAQSSNNVFLETSFTLPYYKGSSIQDDIAFAYKKLGPNKIIYGSDFPYVTFEDSLYETECFFKKYVP